MNIILYSFLLLILFSRKLHSNATILESTSEQICLAFSIESCHFPRAIHDCKENNGSLVSISNKAFNDYVTSEFNLIDTY